MARKTQHVIKRDNKDYFQSTDGATFYFTDDPQEAVRFWKISLRKAYTLHMLRVSFPLQDFVVKGFQFVTTTVGLKNKSSLG